MKNSSYGKANDFISQMQAIANDSATRVSKDCVRARNGTVKAVTTVNGKSYATVLWAGNEDVSTNYRTNIPIALSTNPSVGDTILAFYTDDKLTNAVIFYNCV